MSREKIIAFDLALTFGWYNGTKGGAIRVDDKKRYASFHYEVRRLIESGYTTIVVEDAKFQFAGTSYNFHAQKGILQMICEINDINFELIPVKTVKKVFAGNGNAKKEDIIAECKRRGISVVDHNHADAVAIWHSYKEMRGA